MRESTNRILRLGQHGKSGIELASTTLRLDEHALLVDALLRGPHRSHSSAIRHERIPILRLDELQPRELRNDSPPSVQRLAAQPRRHRRSLMLETCIVLRNLPAACITIRTATIDDPQLERLPLRSTSTHDSLLHMVV